MLAAYAVAGIRAGEDAAFAADVDLMARAARGLADVVLDYVAAGDAVVMVVGPGNNGGDALYAAAHLCDAGRRVNLCLLDADQVHAEGLAAATAAGAHLVDDPRGHRVVVDALFGIGSRVGLTGVAAEWATWIAEAEPFTIAVDVPSGIGVDTGTLAGPHVVADLTVTLGALKVGLVAGPAAFEVGDVALVGLGPEFEAALGAPELESLEDSDGAWFADLVTPSVVDHKYSRGVLGIVAGSAEYAGAAHLCVAGAQAGPCGMIRFAGPPELAARVVDRSPEVVAAGGRVQAWVIGPGGAADAERVRSVLTDAVPAVFDAEALSFLPERFDCDVLLTPHAGELARMLGTVREDVEADPLRAARAAAVRWNATVLLKGARTIVAAPDGRVRVNTSGTPWLGTAGTGDVLAGFAGSLLAGGLEAFDAGSLAAFLHGRAGESVNPGGPITASEVAAELPRVLAEFLSSGARAGGPR